MMTTQSLTLQLMVFGEDDLRGHTLMSEFLTLVHPQVNSYILHTDVMYQQWVHKVENASFTPLIFTTTGGMGDAATQFYKRLAKLLSAKHSISYGIVMGWLRCKLSFSLLSSAIMCIRGTRSSLRCPIAEARI